MEQNTDIEARELAGLLSGAAPEYVHLAIPTHMDQARRLLASDWLAERERVAAEKALEPVEELLSLYESWAGDRPHPGESSPRQRDDLQAAIELGRQTYRNTPEGDAETVAVVRGWRTYPDGSMSPVERWVKHANGEWVSLDSTRRTSGDIQMAFADEDR